MQFTPCQSKALHLLCGKENVFLTGAAGTGKSFLLQQYLHGKSRKEYPVLASTGAAAVIVEGRTFHSFFGLGILEGGRAATVERALRSGPLHKRIQQAECIVVDEVSMLSGETIATAQEIAQCVRESLEPWGGLRMIVVGDFAQLPPVQTEQRDKDWAFLHPAWEQSQFRSVFLQTSVRTNEPNLLKILRSVREGMVTEEVRMFFASRMAQSDPTFTGTRLFPHRVSADRYNMQRLQILPGESRSFETSYAGRSQYVDRLKKQCPIPEVLHLKIGALVMLRKNAMSFPYSYVNGSLGIVKEMNNEFLSVSLLNGENIELSREEFTLLDGNGSVRARAENFPVTLAWATTIHKAQGASIDRLMVSMSGLWESGHAYVALSRARSEEGLFIEAWDEKSIFVEYAVQEFYKSVQSEWDYLSASLPNEPPMNPIPTLKNQNEQLRGRKRKSNIPNHIQTEELIKERHSIKDIATKLGWKEGTIINHIERLILEGHTPDIAYLHPPTGSFMEIKKYFDVHGTEKLKPIHDELEGKYSYDEIRLARVFVLLHEQETSKCVVG
ncbi:AAA family ATPase [Patescibacteria group bacterium]|nr:AAA family ATPase [Patescibacteria group bacterium]MBU1123527.1 AAA family ATPase [Patescibacteria group bacterium]MBU1911864.1 AAA family ATPase [Patescibacteria group bacterium]